MGMTSEQRLAVLEDKQALAELINAYGKVADRFDWEGWAEGAFTEDSEFVFVGGFGVMRGRNEILEVCKGSMDPFYDVMQHILVNLDFEVDGDTATGTSNLIFTAIFDKDKPTDYYQAGGRYQWGFVRTEQGWRIAHTRLEFLWNNGADENSVFEQKTEVAAV